MDAFENPVADGQRSPRLEPLPALDIDYEKLDKRGHNVGWLKRRVHEQDIREKKERLNWMYNWQSPELLEEDRMLDLGYVNPSWAASFSMPDHDTPKNWTRLSEITDDTVIPMQAWMMAHELWRSGFHVTYTFSLSGFSLHLLIGMVRAF